MNARSRAVRLTAVEFDVCWEWLGLGGTPPVLKLPSPGRDADERRRAIAAATHDLRLRGLAGPGGPGEPLARALRLLANPGYELDRRHRARPAPRSDSPQWPARTVRWPFGGAQS